MTNQISQKDQYAQLREMLTGNTLSFLMEAHDGLSARVVERAGFRGIWASGLSISSSFGLRDCNEASWAEVVRTAEYMAEAANIPVLLDGDSGFGNFNSVRQLVRKLCKAGVAGVCIEDALFPKQNSFLGDNHPLASIEEFCGKIRAAKDSQTVGDFSVVARVEALISNRTMEEALERAQAYLESGADAILIHSKKSKADEILEFCDRWQRRGPLVAVPTKYYQTPTDLFRQARISTVIWANHNLRASLKAMHSTSRAIFEQESIAAIESDVESLDALFSLMDYDELFAAERRYLPQA